MLKQLYQQKKAAKQGTDTTVKLRGNQGLRRLAKARKLSQG